MPTSSQSIATVESGDSDSLEDFIAEPAWPAEWTTDSTTPDPRMLAPSSVSRARPPAARWRSRARCAPLFFERPPKQELDLTVETPQVVGGPLLQGVQDRGVQSEQER